MYHNWHEEKYYTTDKWDNGKWMQERLCDTHGFVTGDFTQSEQLYWALLVVIRAHCT
jgi:hypothetical protein